MSSKSTGQRIFAVISIIISVLVLLLAVAGIVGTWAGRSPAIEVATGVLEGVDQLAQVGRNNIARLDTRLANLNNAVGEVEAAVDQIAQNVEDKGLVLTLLPPEKEQQLENTAQQISDGLASVRELIEAVVELKQTIERLPFVDLPEPDPERVQATAENISSVRESVDELRSDIRQFREGASGEISKISTAASNVSRRLSTSQENLAQLDGRLAELQSRANQLKERIPIYVTTVAVLLTLLLAWVSYALVVLIRRALANLRGQEEVD
jgi:chromosome segregation ATPase